MPKLPTPARREHHSWRRLYGFERVEQQVLPISAMAHERMDVAYDYWRRQCGGRDMPSRDDIRPEALRRCLGWINLIDVGNPPLRFRFRLMGSSIAKVYGGDMTGHDIRDLAPADYATLVELAYAAVVASKQPMLHEIVFFLGSHTFRMQRLTLPLSADGVSVNKLMTVSVLEPELRADCGPRSIKTGV